MSKIKWNASKPTVTENISQKSMLVPRYAQHSTRRNVLNIISHNDWFSSITEKVHYSERATLFLFLMVELNHDPSFTKRPLAKPLAKIVSDDQNHDSWFTNKSHYRLTDNKSIARNNILLKRIEFYVPTVVKALEWKGLWAIQTRKWDVDSF